MRFTLGKHLVWRSTPESIAAGMPSLCAILEIPLALALYFSLAYFAGWWTPLLIAAFAAPLVLLRSDASVERAVVMAEGYWKRDLAARPMTRIENVAIVSCAIICSAIISLLLANGWLICCDEWSLLWRGVAMGIIAMNVGFGIAIAFALTLSGQNTWAGTLSWVLAVIVAVAIAGGWAGAGIVTVALAVIVAGAIARVGVLVGAVMVGPGFAAGVFFRCLLIRLSSVLRALPDGFAALPANWRRVMLCEDSFHPPELIPGAAGRSIVIEFEAVFAILVKPSEIGVQNLFVRIFPVLFIIIWFAPAIIWRFALKSTFWLYGPLLFIAHPQAMGGEIERRKWLSRREDLWERHQRWLTTGAAIVAVVMLTDLGGLITNLYHTNGKGIPFLLTWALSLDLGTFFAQPWRWFSLANLVMAMVIFYWRDRLRSRVRNGEEFAMTGWPVGWLVRLARAQVVMFVLYWLVSLFYLAKFAGATGKLPGWLTAWLA